MWVEPDLNMPDGESQVRSLLIGKRFFQEQYGVDVRIGWNPDSFGYNWQLPQIYKRSGMDYFVTQKMTWNDTNQLPFKLFWWQSPDGSKVLTYFPHDYANNNLNPIRLSADLAVARQRAPGMEKMMDLYGIGDHGGGPTRAILDEGNHWAQPGKIMPKMQFGIAQSFFTESEQNLSPNSPVWNYTSIAKGYTFPTPDPGKIAIPTWKDEMYFEYHRGVMTTQAQHKRNMRESEEQTINAEKFASLAWLDGKPYPARRTHRRLEEDRLQRLPRPRRRLRHRHHLQRSPGRVRPGPLGHQRNLNATRSTPSPRASTPKSPATFPSSSSTRSPGATPASPPPPSSCPPRTSTASPSSTPTTTSVPHPSRERPQNQHLQNPASPQKTSRPSATRSST